MIPHISVCICTYRRPALLRDLLRCLEHQITEHMFTYDVVIADNDASQSARHVVEAFGAASPLSVTYCVEPQQNISLARNRAVAHAAGDFIAFIDDDELPGAEWLRQLLQAREVWDADGVLGPVLSRFAEDAPTWVMKGGFYERPRHRTGEVVKWPEARTGNVLFAAHVLRSDESPFRPEFGTGGEDVDFFRRMVTAGRRFVWCDEAAVHELVPAYRCTRRFILRRALLRGSNFPKQSGHRARNIAKSIIAVPCYTLALPLLALMGQHIFVRYLAKLADHASRLVAVAGLPLVRERET